MGKTILKVGCIDQRLILIADPEIASGGQNEDVVEFEFCSLWDGYGKTAVFYRTEDEVYHVLVEDDRCVIPHEVLRDEGVLYFGVFGVKGDTTRTSEVIRYRLVKGALTSGSAPSDPTPDIYAALLARIGAIETILAKPYTLPTASADVKGGVKIGDGLKMDGEVLRVDSVDEAPWEVLKSITTDEIVQAITLDGFSADKILIEVDVPPTGEGAKDAGVVAVNGSYILYNEAFIEPTTTRRARIAVSIKNGYLNIDYCYSVRDTNLMDWGEFHIHKDCALGIAATDIHSVHVKTTGTALLSAGTAMTIKGVRSNA